MCPRFAFFDRQKDIEYLSLAHEAAVMNRGVRAMESTTMAVMLACTRASNYEIGRASCRERV